MMNNKKKGKQQQQQKSLQFSKFFFETKQTNQPADSANIKSILNFFHEEEMAIDNSWEISPGQSSKLVSKKKIGGIRNKNILFLAPSFHPLDLLWEKNKREGCKELHNNINNKDKKTLLSLSLQ
ncbi:hypothetical protein DERP_011993 [Dermatophagoides pteronyssinus]|uniref:Uncharacterized protein n=1 Tax=Dermatophagoides pteronyssinus TaxID=6956 RepID=A0ABQ8IVL8_DERPT|nr:hypothetical protein DERP_011993 [Dermatophagoides pteronyssinus]